MAAKRQLIIEVVGDASRLNKSFKQAQVSVSGFDRTVGLSLRSLAKIGAAVASVDLLAKTVRAGVSEFADQQKVAAQTQAVLKSTGGAAGVTAAQVDKLAMSISNYSGIDDEAIQAGENLLLTFTQIRNGVGKGNDVFDQATRAVADLSVAMGIDATKAALQVGKALNDPARGYARLQRLGVAFTKEQVRQIKTFSALGQTAKAQKVILAELATEFGGSARALGQTVPGQLNRLREALRNISGEIVGALVGPFTSALNVVNRFVGEVSEAAGVKAKIQVAVELAGEAARTGVDFLRPLLDRIRNADYRKIGSQVSDAVVRGLQAAASFLQGQDFQAIGNRVASGLFGAIGDFVAGVDWVALVKAIVGYIAAAVTATVQLLKGVGAALASALFDGLKAGLEALGNAAKKLALKAVIKILEPFDVKVFGVSIVPGMDALIGNLEKKLGEMEQTAATGAKRVADALTGTGSPLTQLAGRTAAAPARKPASTTTTGTARAGVTASQRNQWFDAGISRQLDRVQDIRTVSGQIAALKKIAGLIGARLAATKDVTRRLNLEDQLLAVRRQQRTLAEQRRTELLDAIKARQFKTLGFAADGSDLVPGVKALRRQLGSITQSIAGTLANTSKNRSVLSNIRKVLGTGIKDLSKDVRSKIRELLNGIDQELRDNAGGPLTKTTALNIDRIVNGLGLGDDAERQIRSRLSRFNSAGVALAGSGGTAGPIQVASTIVIDGKVIARSTTKHQQNGRRRNPPQRRGPNAGRLIY